jgi:cellulose synthase/poly-beta-1,6-N-acetylglucosamine synthase-like glycosyltransferase
MKITQFNAGSNNNIEVLIMFIVLPFLIGIGALWIYFICTVIWSYLKTPSIRENRHNHNFSNIGRSPTTKDIEKNQHQSILFHNDSKAFENDNLLLVSIIVPARNEQANIERCLTSLSSQTYPNLEIIAVDDNSNDQTLAIMKQWQMVKIPTVKKVVLSLKQKPEDWTGKAWASQQGYLISHGDILLFTDADCYYTSKDAISLAIKHLLNEDLDVLTGIPHLPLQDFWSKIVMPVWNIFLEAFGNNASKVNDPKSDIAYVMGSFFMIKRKVFESIGTFQGVRREIQEDRAIGNLIKKNNYNMRLFMINTLVTAKWSRDVHTLWHGIGRTLAPQLLSKDKRHQIVIQQIVFFSLAVFPFIVLPYTTTTSIGSLIFVNNDDNSSNHIPLDMLPSWSISSLASITAWLNIAICMTVLLAVAVKDMYTYRMMPWYSLFTILGASFLIVAYASNLSSLLLSNNIKPFVWRGRTITTL